MARIRSVKPEICESETMAQCSAEVERTFVRLWTHCDDHGRAKDDPRLIKAALFPLHDGVTVEDVDAHLSVLAGKGLIVRYQVDGKRFLACPSWTEHQHPQRARDSKIPEPPVSVADVYATAPVPDTDASGPVVGGVEVEGDVVGEVDEEVLPGGISGDPPVPPEQIAAEPPKSIDQQTNEAVAIAARLIAERDATSNPAGLAVTVGATIAKDGRRNTLRDFITAGLTPDEAAVRLTDPFGGLAGVVDPAEVEAARIRSQERHRATVEAAEAQQAAPRGDATAGIAAARAASRQVAS